MNPKRILLYIQIPFFVLILLVFPVQNYSQGIAFGKVYDGNLWENSTCIVETYDGGAVISGLTRDNFGGVLGSFALKINELGDSVWAIGFPGDTTTPVVHAVVETSDSGLVLLGEEFSSNRTGGLLIKLDAGGGLEWRQFLDEGTIWKSGIVNGQGNLIVCGGGEVDSVSPQFRAKMIEIDLLGNLMWRQSVGVGVLSGSYEIKAGVNTNEFSVLGSASDVFLPATSYPFLLKVDSNGNQLSLNTYPSLVGVNWSHAPIPSGKALAIGSDQFISGLGNSLTFLDQMGDTLWTRSLPDSTYGCNAQTIRDLNSNFLFAGAFGDSVAVGKVDSSGNALWEEKFSFGDEVNFSKIALTAAGGWWITGNVFANGNPIAFFVLKSATLTSLFPSGLNEVFWELFPNPTSDKVSAVFHGKALTGVGTLTDAQGMVVRDFEFQKKNEIQLSLKGLSRGIYLLTIQITDGERHSKRVVKR